MRHIPAGSIGWEFFQSEFQKMYVGELNLEDQKQEFIPMKQGELSTVNYEREYLLLSNHDLKLIPTEEASCKTFLRGLRDELITQLVSLRIKEFADLSQWAKMVEKSMGLDKKAEPLRVTRKQFGSFSSHPMSK